MSKHYKCILLHINHWLNALREAAGMTGCTDCYVITRKRGWSHSVFLPIHFRCYIITRVSPHLSELFRLFWPPGPRFRSNQHRTSRRNGSPGSSCSLRDESGLICRQPWLRVKDRQLAATARKPENSLLPNWWRAFKEWNDSLSTSGALASNQIAQKCACASVDQWEY